MANKFMMPRLTFLGEGALFDAMDDIAKLGKKALLVTGQSMIRQGHVPVLIEQLAARGVEAVVFSDITGEPTNVMVEAGAELYRSEGCDFLIGFGGGSPLDSAKAIGVLVSGEGKIADYNGKVITNPVPSIVGIPTTAGTGSEVTQFTIISDVETNVKMLLKGAVMLPEIAVIDPAFTMETPPSVTAATGLDALTHAVEAYTSRKAFAETDIFVTSAIKRIFANLPLAYADGSNKEARTQMALAAYEAGVGINNSSVTIVHGMSRPIGALFHVPHGISNAMLLGEVLAFAKDGALGRFADLGRLIGVAEQADSDAVAADKFLDAIKQLCATCDVPTLEGYGIDRDAFMAAIPKMAVDAKASGSPDNTQRIASVEEIEELYRKLWA